MAGRLGREGPWGGAGSARRGRQEIAEARSAGGLVAQSAFMINPSGNRETGSEGAARAGR